MIPVFSIIIPSYKSDKFIKQCISSVLHQTFDSFEIIIIDDGSPDQTGEICLRIAADYPYVRYIYQEHQVAGAARNKGLRVANGEYVLFLDADDYWVNRDLLKEIYNCFKNQNVDLVMFQMDKYTEKGRLLKRYRKKAFPDTKLSHCVHEIYPMLVRDGQVLASACNKCVKRSLLEEEYILFPEGGYAEDIDWVIQLFSRAKYISFLNGLAYAYRQHGNSTASRSTEGPNHLAAIIQKWAEKVKQNEVPDPEVVAGLLAFEYGICMGHQQYLSREMKIILKEYQYLLHYAMDKKTKVIRLFHRIFGYWFTCNMIRFYLFCRRI